MIGRRVELVIGDRIDEHLKCERRASPMTGQQRDDGRKIAAAAVAPHGDTIRIHVQIRRVVVNPARDGETIVNGRWKLDFRGQAVLCRDDKAAGAIGRSHDTRSPPSRDSPVPSRLHETK